MNRSLRECRSPETDSLEWVQDIAYQSSLALTPTRTRYPNPSLRASNHRFENEMPGPTHSTLLSRVRKRLGTVLPPVVPR